MSDLLDAALRLVEQAHPEPDGGQRFIVSREDLTALAQQVERVTNEHPESYCQRCGRPNVHSWSVDSDRFNAAMGALGLDRGAIVCPVCFTQGHVLATNLRTSWNLMPGTPFRPVETP